MEALLQAYYGEGMTELSFLIVNAHDSLSQLMIDQLKERVSFPVYQDNPEDDVWNVLNGGKDDMYIYDRCGRLTFYIPFPLSIIHPRQTILSSAIYATYFNKLCGDSCLIFEEDSFLPSEYQELFDYTEVNDTNSLDVEDIKNVLGGEDNVNRSEVLVEDIHDEFSFHLNNSFLANETDFSITNETAMSNETDFDITNETAISNETDFSITNETAMSNEIELLENITVLTDMILTGLLNSTDISENEITQINNTEGEESVQENSQLPLNKSAVAIDGKKAVTGRCLDPLHKEICLNWTKKKLKKAKRCCISHNSRHQSHCKDYPKMKCKKLRPVLKCCLGTADVATQSSISDTATTPEEHFTITE